MRTRRLLELLAYSSLFATTGCEHAEELEPFATRAMYGTEIDACLNDETKCSTLCSHFVDPDHEVDFDRFERCAIIEEHEDRVKLAIEYTYTVNCGRRPDGYRDADECLPTAAGWLARVATLEAASVVAFQRLVDALTRLHAPRALIARARRAVADEIRHARLVERLVRRLDPHVRVAAPRLAEVAPPTLAQLAHENAVEGQVGETFGALVATCQARAARDPIIRRVFGGIAHDEAQHAVLAYQLQPWLESQLAPTERNEIAQARHDATSRILATRVGGELAPRDRAVLGLPDPRRLGAAASKLFASV